MTPGYLNDGEYDEDGVRKSSYSGGYSGSGYTGGSYGGRTGGWFRNWGLGTNQEIEALRKVAASLSESYNIKIEIKEYEKAVAHVNRKTNVITIGTQGIYTNGSDYYVGLLLHEIGHIRHSPSHEEAAMKPIDSFKNPIIARLMWNMLEDKRIDERMKDDYSGAASYYDALYNPLMDEVVQAMDGGTYEFEKADTIDEFINARIQERHKVKNFKDDKDIQAFREVCKEHLLFRACGYASMEVAGRVDAESTTGVREVDAMSSGIANLIRESTDSRLSDEQVVGYTLNVLKILDPLIPSKEHSQENQKSQGQGDGIGGVGHGEGEPSEGEGSEGHEGEKGHAGHDVKEMFKRMGGGHKTTESSARKGYVEDKYVKADERMASLAGSLRRKLIGVMRDNERAKYIGGKRRGVINKRALSRVARNNYRLYRQRVEPKGKKYAVAIVEDCSGSMWSSVNEAGNAGRAGTKSDRTKIEYAHEMVALLTRVFRSLGFPTGISIYGSHSKTVLNPKDRYVVKSVNDRMETSNGAYYHSGSNETHQGIKNALTYLKKSGAGRQKLLIVITDGGLDGGDVDESRKLLQKEMKHGDFYPMIYYVENGTQRILKDERYEAYIPNPSVQLVQEAVRLMKKVVPPLQELD